jgi:two-component system, NtrC family, response regulator HydG
VLVNKILVVEDQPREREAMCRLLRSEGFAVASAGTKVEALAYVDDSIHLVISDLRLGNESGLNLLREIRSQYATLPVIVVTAYGDISTAVQAIKMGAFDFLPKPLEPSRLLSLIREKLSQIAPMASSKQALQFGGMIGASSVMRSVYARIRASEVDCNVLITGETGTGKELVADALHKSGKRSGKPFVVTNISAVPVGLVEAELFGVAKGAYTDAFRDREGVLAAADSGTLFIDEVGELPLNIQPKLLRVLEGAPISSIGSRELRNIDVRFVFATHRDLLKMVAQEQFRSDLWHRMSVLTIDLPPLRERREDIPILFESFLIEFCKRHRSESLEIAPELRHFIESYEWPGNIRQLRNAVESMVVMHRGTSLSIDDLSQFLRREAQTAKSKQSAANLRDYERTAILNTLRLHLGNRTAAALELGISVRTLQRKLKRWGIEEPCDRDSYDI